MLPNKLEASLVDPKSLQEWLKETESSEHSKDYINKTAGTLFVQIYVYIYTYK